MDSTLLHSVMKYKPDSSLNSPRDVLNSCTLKKIVPETASNFRPNASTGTTPGIHVHKN